MPPKPNKSAPSSSNKPVNMPQTAQKRDRVFNSCGHGFLHNISPRTKNLVLAGLPYSTQTVVKQIETLGTSRNVPPLTPTATELDTTEKGAEAYLMIGLTIIGENDLGPFLKANKESSSKAVDQLPDSELVDVTNMELARVVVRVPKDGQIPTNLKAGGMVHYNGTFCTVNDIRQDAIFYFAEFRDGSTAGPTRKREWTRLVRVQLEKIMTGTTSGSSEVKGVQTFRKAKDASFVPIDQGGSFSGQLVLGAQLLQYKCNDRTVSNLQQLLSRIDNSDLPSKQSVNDFVDGTIDFTEDLAEEFLEALRESMKDLDVSVSSVVSISTILRRLKVSVPFYGIRRLLEDGHDALNSWTDASGNLDQEAAEKSISLILKSIQREKLRGSKPVLPSENVLIIIRGELHRLLEFAKKNIERMKDSVGGQALPLSLASAIESYALSMDVDSAKLAYSHGMRRIIGDLAEITQAGCVETLEGLIAILDMWLENDEEDG